MVNINTTDATICPNCKRGQVDHIHSDQYRCSYHLCRRLLRKTADGFTDYLDWQRAGRKRKRGRSRFTFKKRASRTQEIQTAAEMTEVTRAVTEGVTGDSVGSDGKGRSA